VDEVVLAEPSGKRPEHTALAVEQSDLVAARLDEGPLLRAIVPAVFNSGHLCGSKLSATEEQHLVYFEERGRRDGCPIVVLHGGPGTPIHEEVLGILGGENIRGIIPHQRGVGLSMPQGEMSGNTTAHLLRDLEQLREHLGLERWHVFGWSWGSTLGLAYAETYPERVISITTFGTYLGTRSEDDFYLEQMAKGAPETHQRYLEYSPPQTCRFYAQGFQERLESGQADEAIRLWYEIAPDREIPTELRERAKVSIGYFANGCFLKENQILSQLSRLAEIPCTLVHGAKDPYCPVSTVEKMQQILLGQIQTKVFESGSHSLSEPEVQRYLFEHFCRLSEDQKQAS
jgi:proline iminopeptidase